MTYLSAYLKEQFSGATASDFLRVMCGDKLGSGVGRDVYACNANPDLVVKFETSSQSFQNVIEWETWQRAKDCKFIAEWLAPCFDISPCGSVLLQYRTQAATNFPDRLPNFLTDTKRANYGLYKKHFVCHDYGTHLLFEKGMTKRFRKVTWW